MPRKRESDGPEGQGQEWHFIGFRSPTYTQTPDELFDWLMARLTGAELKVVLYIVRRTFGFSKNADAISIEQICSGIVVKKTGKRLDMGTGLGRSTVTDALRSLKEKNIIQARTTLAASGADGPTLYSLNIIAEDAGSEEDEDPRVQRWNEGGSARVAPRVRKSGPYHPEERTLGAGRVDGGVHQSGRGESALPDPQETVEQETEYQERDLSNSSNDTQPGDNSDQGRAEKPQTVPRYSDFIAQVARDYTRLFHDTDHERPNRSRALRLWAESGLAEHSFVELMHEARKITQARGNIARDATDGSPTGTKNRMPYYYSVLEDLLGVQADER